jgi:DNA-directed RNA polymerase subunit RPC12/RpoP
MIFTEKDFQNYSKEELEKKLLDRLKYNDYEYNAENKIKFVGKYPNIHGLDNIIYKCPKCNREFNFEIDKDTMTCRDCGFSVSMNEYYELSSANGKPFADVDAWFKWQRQEIRKEIKNPDFVLSTPTELFTVNTAKLDNNYSQLKLGDGEIKLTREGLYYNGTKNGENVSLFFEAKSVYSLSISLDYELDFYYKHDYYCFKPTKDKKQVVKWMLASEEIHNLYDESWAKARREVYLYED